jgi:hypothetical protein
VCQPDRSYSMLYDLSGWAKPALRPDISVSGYFKQTCSFKKKREICPFFGNSPPA